MSAVRWIKLSTDLFNDEKIKFIEQMPEADGILTIWIKLLVLAGVKNSGGEVYFNDEVPYTDELLATIFNRKLNLIRLALETFQKLRMIEIDEDRTIIICNWNRHQTLDRLEKLKQDAAERQKKLRERRRAERLGIATDKEGLDRLALRDRNVTGDVTARDASHINGVTASAQSKKKSTELPSAVSLFRETSHSNFIVEGKITLPSDAKGKQQAIGFAKAVICEKILGGKDPGRPWSRDAMDRLTELLESGLPLIEIERIGWVRALPKADDVPELKKRVDPITETGLMNFWGDEFSRADSYWKKTTGRNGAQKKEPDRWREFFKWQYQSDVTLPESFYELDADQQAEYHREFQTFANATREEAVA